MAQFKKGQKVYLVSTHCAEVYRPGRRLSINITCILERTVDACGAKQMTFEDHGNDSIFGKKAYAPFTITPLEGYGYPSHNYFGTIEEARAYQHGIKNYTRADGYQYEYVHVEGVFTDQSTEWLTSVRKIKSEIESATPKEA